MHRKNLILIYFFNQIRNYHDFFIETNSFIILIVIPKNKIFSRLKKVHGNNVERDMIKELINEDFDKPLQTKSTLFS